MDPCFRRGDEARVFLWVGRGPMNTRNEIRVLVLELEITADLQR